MTPAPDGGIAQVDELEQQRKAQKDLIKNFCIDRRGIKCLHRSVQHIYSKALLMPSNKVGCYCEMRTCCIETAPMRVPWQRMSALYVDAVSPDQWNRPINEISAAEAFDYLQDAANDYSIQRERYTNLEIGKPDDPKFYSALETWTERPILPSPKWPSGA